MIHSTTAELTYIQFRSTDIETAEKFFQHKIEKIDDKNFEIHYNKDSFKHLMDGYVYVKLNGSDIPVSFENLKTLTNYFNINETAKKRSFYIGGVEYHSRHDFNKHEAVSQDSETDKTSNVPGICDPLLFGEMHESINIESELERILTIQKNRTINLGDIEKAKFENELDSAVLYNFNVGLLCGIKLARGAK